MKKILLLTVLSGLSFIISGCVTYGAPFGSLFTNVTMNKDISTTTDVGTKTGKACAQGFLNIVAIGDASIETAARLGQINVIHSVDYSSKSVLAFLYQEMCTIVNGQ